MNRGNSLFVLDTNIFIEAHRRYYAFDLCPGFWECLAHYCREGQVRSIDQVRDEIVSDDDQPEQPPDQLCEWIEQAPDELFMSTAEQSTLNAFTEMNNWVLENKQFQPQAQKEFVNVADGWVAAYARAHHSVVVTHEMFNVDVKKRVPLPNVCEQFGVNYCDTFEMLHTLDVRFDWEPPY